MSLDTSKKSQYHSALAANSPLTVQVVAEPRESKYKKQGEAGHLYVKLNHDGYEFTYGAENEACAKPFEGKQGETIAITASGRGDSARISIQGENPDSRVEQAPRPEQKKVLTPQTEVHDDSYQDFRHALMRVMNAFWLIERGVGVESDQSKVNGFDTSEAHLQAKCSTAFIHLDKLGLVKAMPDKPIWGAKEPKKELPVQEIKKVFPDDNDEVPF